jgi:divalent metal cation (Fe/Co/Zn/Cd) transporter
VPECAGRLQIESTRPLSFAPERSSRTTRLTLERRARLLAACSIAWHFVEFAVALAAGIVAGSVALIGFGADSLIEALAGFIVLWLFTGARRGSRAAEHRAQKLIATSFFLLAAYIGIETLRTLLGSAHSQVSWIGIGLAAVTATTMPVLARAKRKNGERLNSSAIVKEAAQNQLCAYLSIALLIGLATNALLGWWWADPLVALMIAGVAVKEGRESWCGEGCANGCC